jgi:L-iditol 2-dehydrogenase
MLQLAKLSGASTLITVEPIQGKRDMALKLGADIVIDPFNQNIEEILSIHNIKYIDATIECVGLRNTMIDAVKYACKSGTVMMFGLTHPACEIPLMPFDVFKREITVKASFINPYTQKRAVSLLESGKVNVKDLITDKVKLTDINKVFEDNTYRSRGKVIIVP